MKYLFTLVIERITFNCSPKLSPDAGWGINLGCRGKETKLVLRRKKEAFCLLILPYLYIMRCTVFLFVIGFCLTATINSCKEYKDLDSWLGNYKYEEQPIEAIAGYNMVMSWDLSIHRVNDKYSSILNVNGQQTAFSCQNKLIGNDSTLFIIYDQLLNGNIPTLDKGDTLFVLSKSFIRMTTKWRTLKPILSEFSPDECECFAFAGTNTNNNILNTNK